MPAKESKDYMPFVTAMMILGLFVAAWYFDWFAAISQWFENMNNVLR